MAYGRLRAIGTELELTKKYGQGYQLSVSALTQEKRDTLEHFVRAAFSPGAARLRDADYLSAMSDFSGTFAPFLMLSMTSSGTSFTSGTSRSFAQVPIVSRIWSVSRPARVG